MRQVEPTAALISSLAYFLMNLSIRPYVELDTIYGRIRGGRTIARNGNPYAEFLNIPYAQPPVGKLRFESPLTPTPWKGVQDATNYGNACLQYEFLTHFRTGAEDCLNLNVYTNQISDRGLLKSKRLKPVIVYFYGGLFMSGFSFIYRAKYFMEEDVVLVTVNYRVNALGFLNTGDGLIRGNMGLKDQVMALRWVKDNIELFGGDPNLVTIMGQSAGGASAHLHLLSNMSSGLFHRAVSLSGTALNSWALASTSNPKEQAVILAKKVGCYKKYGPAMVACLKSVHSHRIVRAQKDYLSPLADPLTLFTPSIETIDDSEAFLTAHPRTLIQNGSFPNHVPWMTGVTNAEGLLASTYLLVQPAELKKLESDWNEIVPSIFSYKGNSEAKTISAEAHTFYFGNQSANPNTFDNVTRLYTDGLFNLALQESLVSQVRVSKSPIYAYYFTYERNFGLANHMTQMIGQIPRYLDYGIGATRTWLRSKIHPQSVKNYGVCHADELGLLFNVPTLGDEITPGSEDYSFSSAFVKLIVAFAANGQPGNFYGRKWDPVVLDKYGQFSLFQLGETPGNILPPFQDSMNFWKKLKLKYRRTQ